MPEPLASERPNQSPARPFPWFCPKCRRKEVRRVTIPYQCERRQDGQLITVTVPNLAVPRCGNCGELVFDYDAEEQIRQACEGREGTRGMSDGNLIEETLSDGPSAAVEGQAD